VSPVLAKELEEALTRLGVCQKLVEIERTGECRLLVCKRQTTNLVIALASYSTWVYAKMVPEEGLPGHMWHCDQVFYTPYGLYAFAHTLDELARKIQEKTAMLEAIARLAAERAAAMGLE
jgi:hypothetical protein